ncbi:hypothetical protein Ccel_1613 [Ruminiclostridium cellulolyticum H10]|uniref:Uncharacterized protein n=1 Tax=Ruminiclostridium cellulolyticum (strain ATCC 35319 / DSM 5812 / JCM 6584 / H10) TaxID=394503 RepID=B8I2H2_RUMCH|nr:hypothetical protein Ccel_1613 [Ruminiclostridium cellulolyticum H10]
MAVLEIVAANSLVTKGQQRMMQKKAREKLAAKSSFIIRSNQSNLLLNNCFSVDYWIFNINMEYK